MGIFTFAGSWVLKKFRGTLVVQNFIPSNVSSLVIDMNGTIHRALQKVYYYGDFADPDKNELALATPWPEMKAKIFSAIMTETDEIIARIMPKEILVIAIDGPTNVAKMQQQRTRRYRAAFHRKEDSFDTSIITPGTDFMFEIDEMFRRELVERRASYPPTVIYSSHLAPGEGEHKLMEMYRKGDISSVEADGKHVIYGLDADLILLSLISPQKEVMLVREDRRELLDIELFRQALINAAPDELKESAIIDFIILMTLVGNDFIPHGPLHHSMYDLVEGLLAAYYKVGKPLSVMNNGTYTVNLKAVGMVAHEMHIVQAERLAYEAMHPNFRDDQPAEYNRFTQGALRRNPETDEVVFDFDAFRSIWYTNAFGCNNGGNPINDDFTDEDITDMCESYAEGIVWCTRYYQTKDIDSKWVYKYFHAPLFIDLAEYLMSLDDGYGPKLDDWLTEDFNLEWDALVQLGCVMPKNSKHFPGALRNLSKYIPDMFPDKIIFESDGFDEVRNYNVIMPIITIDRMVEAVDMLKLVDRRRWSPTGDTVFDSTEAQQSAYSTWYQNQIYINEFTEKQARANRARNIMMGGGPRGGGGRGRGGPRSGGGGSRGGGPRSGGGGGRGGYNKSDKDRKEGVVVVGERSRGTMTTSVRTHGRFL
jgi:5'-3' exonuclease